jgi:chaperonin GroEL
MAKDIVFNQNVREKITKGVSKICAAVKVTLGPTGRVVMIQKEFGNPYVTKDGVTVASEVELSDVMENMAAQLVRQATSRTAKEAGDGTTTATIYVDSIYNAGLKYIAANARPQLLRKGMEKAVELVTARLAELSRPVISNQQIKQVAVCSANQDQVVGGIVAEAIDAVGKDGVVTIEDGRTLETFVRTVDGFQFDRGFMSPHSITDPQRQLVEYEKPIVLLTDYRVTTMVEIVSILEKVMKVGEGRPLVLIADDVDGEAQQILAVNSMRGKIKATAVKAPSFGERRADILGDLAAVLGATVISKDSGRGLEDISRKDFGTCDRIVIDRDTTTIFGGGDGDEGKNLAAVAVQERIDLVQSSLAATVTDYDREGLQSRLARLTGGVAQIVVGGATEAEIKEKRDRIDDAVHACKAASQEGILPGGGTAPLVARQVLEEQRSQFASDDEWHGAQIIWEALAAPVRQIAANSGVEPGYVLREIDVNSDPAYGYNAAVGKFGNMLDFGIIVPTKVERVALQNAASVAILLLATDCMISILPEKPLDTGGAGPLSGMM